MAIGVCGGSAFTPLCAEPPQSNLAGAQSARDITVTGQHPIVIGGRSAPAPCVAADVAGRRIGATDCAAAKLDEAAKAASTRAQADPTFGVPNAGSGDTKVGVGSLTGSSQRLGADLRGRTSLPVRPALPPPANPFPR